MEMNLKQGLLEKYNNIKHPKHYIMFCKIVRIDDLW